MDKLLHFVETTAFTKQIDKLGSVDVLTAMQDDLLENPERGAVIEGTGGARKARVGDPNQKRGKSGAFRYLYAYFVHADTIYLLYLFAKNEQANLTAEQKKFVKALIDEARKNLEGE